MSPASTSQSPETDNHIIEIDSQFAFYSSSISSVFSVSFVFTNNEVYLGSGERFCHFSYSIFYYFSLLILQNSRQRQQDNLSPTNYFLHDYLKESKRSGLDGIE